MIPSRLARRLMLTLCFSLIVTATLAQAGSGEYKPVERQDGKDVVWLPTAQALVDKMLDVAKVTPQDYVIDFGSGDGGAPSSLQPNAAPQLSVLNIILTWLRYRNAMPKRKASATRPGSSRQTCLRVTSLKPPSLRCFCCLRSTSSFARRSNRKPGTRIVSNSFEMGEWIADQTATVDDSNKCSEYCTALLWIVPAKVQGTWKLPQAEIVLEQSFQTFSGRLNSRTEMLLIKNGRLSGDQISFTAGAAQYTGRVSGNAMQGTLKSGDRIAEWRAIRVNKVASR